MDLHAATPKKIKQMLKDAGVYEAGMGEEEMRQLADAMQTSMIETCEQEANELEFLRLQTRNLHSSTLIVAPQLPISADFVGWASPPSVPIYLTVQAMVHHAMDWSPSKNEGVRRKRSSSDSNPPVCGPGAKRSLWEGDQQEEERRSDPDAMPVSPNQGDVDDSGINWEEISISSVSGTSFISSIGEIPSDNMVSTSSVAVSESSENNDEPSHDQISEYEELI